MIKKILLLSLLMFEMCGCAVARKTYAPDGSEGYVLNCSGTASTWGRCYERAGDICGERGYEVLEKISENLQSSSGTAIERHSATDFNRNLIIKCRPGILKEKTPVNGTELPKPDTN